MRVLVRQTASAAGNVEAAFADVACGLRTAAAAGAGMAVFPELFLPGYNHADVAALAQPSDGPWIARLCALAREARVGLTVGYAERDGDRVFNSAIALDAAGAVLARYRKIQLYGPREAALFTPGDRYEVFEFAGRRAALLICYDIEFAGHVAALAARGVELLLVPTANMDPFDHVPRLTVPSQAVNHAVAIVYANYCGTEGDLTYCGGSLVVAADGAVLVRAGRGAAMLVADLGQPPDPAKLSTQARDWRPLG